MTPNDLDAYLKVMNGNQVGAAVLDLPGGVKLSVTFAPEMPKMVGTEPTPGGWKSPIHLDNPEALRENDYNGSLPE